MARNGKVGVYCFFQEEFYKFNALRLSHDKMQAFYATDLCSAAQKCKNEFLHFVRLVRFFLSRRSPCSLFVAAFVLTAFILGDGG